MGFLKNDGDIILDAVLTDLGRERLARGNGSFSIGKFALSDDEINYGLFDKGATTAYQDLTILQTPVLEAFTDNAALMQHKLLSYGNDNQLYLPVLNPMTGPGTAMNSLGLYYVVSDLTTLNNLTTIGTTVIALDDGILNGYAPGDSTNHIRVDQGLDTLELAGQTLPEALTDRTYLIELNNRLGGIYAPPAGAGSATTALPFQFIDDDGIASYSETDGGSVVRVLTDAETSSIRGPRGTSIEFRIGSSLELRTSSFPFTQIGSIATTALTNGAPGGAGQTTLAAGSYYILDTVLSITGASTGANSQLTLRFIRSI